MNADDLPSIEALLARRGPFSCRCGIAIGHPGACEDCDRAWERKRWDREVMSWARSSIPDRFRWARYGHPDLATRVAPENVRAVLEIPSPLKCGVAIVGASGAGKTTLACALLRRIHDSATPERSHEWVERARKAVLVDAGEYLAACAEYQKWSVKDEPKIVTMAHTASLLVLDNVEPGTFAGPLGQLVQGRHNRDATTIVTTWMTQDVAVKHYGHGWARRVYEFTVPLVAPAVGT